MSAIATFPRRRSLLAALGELLARRELLWSLAARDIKVRYKQSVLGIGWAIAQPLSLTLLFTFVFARLVKLPTDGVPYPVFSYAGLLPWTFFASSLAFGLPSLVSNMHLLGKIYFPREIFPLAALLACLLDFAVAAGVFGLLLAFYRIPFTAQVLWLPALVLVQVLFSAAILLLTSAANVFYRDIRYLVPLVLQIGMYLSPVVYPASVVPARFRGLYALNPMTAVIEGYRRAFLHGRAPDVSALALAGALSLAGLAGAYLLFKRAEMRFADVI